MGKKKTPPPPDILRKSAPHKDKKKYDRKRVKKVDLTRGPDDKSDKGSD